MRDQQKDGGTIFVKKGKKMLSRLAQIKQDNPKPSDPPTGWNVDMHQGGHNGINWR